MTDRVLYSYWRSSAAYRVRIALGLKGLDFATRTVDLTSGAQAGVGFTLLNPQGLLPYLIDGEAGLNQSLAILEYLDETYPEPPLLPRGPVARARVRSAALTIACDIHPLGNLRVLNYLRGTLVQPGEAVESWARHWIELGLAALEEITESGNGAYLCGDQLTIADVCLVPQMYNARRFQADVARFPRLSALDRRLVQLPAFAAARPEAQPDAPQP